MDPGDLGGLLSRFHVETVDVKPLYIEYSKPAEFLGKLRLTAFQAELHRRLRSGSDILLQAPTGSGKTLTLLLSPGFSKEATPGFTALYPNNTLLKNQMETVAEVVERGLGGKLYRCLYADSSGWCAARVYKVGCFDAPDVAVRDVSFIALIAFSGKYIEGGSDPKREVIYRIASNLFRTTGQDVYSIVFSTPDAFLLALTGAYRDFEGVGKTIHNIAVATLEKGSLSEDEAENVIRSTGVAPRSVVAPIVAVVERLLLHPLFIDEFHLYSPYELDSLYALIEVYRGLASMPIVLSSATPSPDSLKELKGAGLNPVVIEAAESSEGFPVKGGMRLVVVGVDTRFKGLSAFYEAATSRHVIDLAKEVVASVLRSGRGDRVLVILDRLWMVANLVETLHRDLGVAPECIASDIIVKGLSHACSAGSSVIVGSEAATQGVNLGPITVGVMSGVSAEDVVQRMGRVGRRGVDSTVYLIVPSYVLDSTQPPRKADYRGLVEWLSKAYPDYPRRARGVNPLMEGWEHLRRLRRHLIKMAAAVAYARNTGNRRLLRGALPDKHMAAEILNRVVGPPSELARILLFRRSGFKVKYRLPSGVEDEEDIGVILRNFNVVGVSKDALIVELVRSRSSLTVKTRNRPSLLGGKLVSLTTLLSLLDGNVVIESGGTDMLLEHVADTLVYVTSASGDLSTYISYSGEGAAIDNPLEGRKYSLIFI